MTLLNPTNNREAASRATGCGFAAVSGRRRDRRGSALLFVVVLLFIILALAALVIDLGVARSTHQTMEGAARSGALEGLRQRDNPAVDPRIEARAMVAVHFADGIDTTEQEFGAGPEIELTPGGGLGEFSLVDLDSRTQYFPVLQLNDGSTAPLNEPHGDMLTGTYNPGAVHNEHVGGVPYARADFDPAGPGELADSFLLRIRRTYNPSGLDEIEGVSSRGLSVPFIWGRGAAIFTENPTVYDPRTDGIPVISRAIADAEPALSLGPPNPAFGIDGHAPFAIRLEFWQALPPGVPTPVVLFAGGGMGEFTLTPFLEDARLWGFTTLDQTIGANATVFDVTDSSAFPDPPFLARIGQEIIRVTDVTGTQWTVERGFSGSNNVPHLNGQRVRNHEVRVIGDNLEVGPADRAFLPRPTETYVPIYSLVPPGERRVVAFGRARLEDLLGVGPPFTFPTTVFITRELGEIAPENASATPVRALDDDLTPLGVNLIFAARRLVEDPLQAPALVRSQGQ